MITIEEYSKILEGVNGYICRNEGYKLYTLACECRGTQVLEIGALQGFSSIALALFGKHVLSIDLWDGADLSDGTRHIETNLEIYEKNLTNRDLNNFTPYKMSSKEASAIIDCSKVGLIFIDGNHRYKAVCSDIKDWADKLTPGTWLLFHDYTNPCGVKQAVDEWIEKNPDRIQETIFIQSIIGFLLK